MLILESIYSLSPYHGTASAHVVVFLCWHSAFCSKQSVVLQNALLLELTKYKRHVVNEKSCPTCKCPVAEMAKERRARVWLTRCPLVYSVLWQDAHRRLYEPCVYYFPRCKRTSGGNGKRERERIKMPLWNAFTFRDGIANVAESNKLMYCIRIHSLIQMTTIYSSYLVYVILHYLVTAAARLQHDNDCHRLICKHVWRSIQLGYHVHGATLAL